MREKLRKIVEDNSTRKGRIFDTVIQVLILSSLVAFSIETLPDISKTTAYYLRVFEVVCIGLFTFEYFLRIYVAKKPFKYIFSFYGIIDLLAIFPFYINTIYDFRAVRTFRVFSIFKSLQLVRYSKALNRFRIAARIVKEEMILFLIITLIFIFLAASGIYYFEHEAQPKLFPSVIHSIWWAIVTLTTVGYGDVYPITAGGKVFTFFMLMIGIAVITIPAGLVASAFTKAREIEKEDMEKHRQKHSSEKLN